MTQTNMSGNKIQNLKIKSITKIMTKNLSNKEKNNNKKESKKSKKN